MSKPTLALIPSGQKATKVYSVLPSDGSGDFTFARTGDATRVRKDGLIETVATTVPRLDWLNSDCPNLLLEPSKTNSQQYSELSTGKTVTGGTLTDNNAIAPTGEKKAMQLKEDTNNSRHRFYVGGVLSTTFGTQYTLSLFVKKQSGNRFIFINAGAFIGVSGSFNLDTQAVTGDVQLFETYPNGWYRIGITATATATHTSGYFVQLQQGTSDADYTGDGSSVLVWGLQFEESGLSSYIANLSNGSTTRNLETCKIADFSSMPSNYPITVYGEVIPNELSSTSYSFSLLKDVDTDANYYLALLLRNTSTVKIVRRDTDTTASNSISHTLSVGTPFKFAVCFQNETDFKYSFDGLSAVTVTSSDAVTWDYPDVLLGALRLSADTGKRNPIKEFRLYDTALTDAELKELTT